MRGLDCVVVLEIAVACARALDHPSSVHVLRRHQHSLVGIAVAIGVACSSSQRAPVRDDSLDPPPFAPVSASVYVAKVKNVLVGLPPTDEEVRAVTDDPATLSALVDGWQELPEYRRKMQRFFQLAFQQTQISANDFSSQIHAPISMNDSTAPLILQNVQESFARTMVELTSQGHPFTEAMTTDRVMMTTALKELYAFLDVWDLDNEGDVHDAFRNQNRDLAIIVQASEGPIPIEQSLDPASPNYMRWHNPDVGDPSVQVPGCQQDPVSLAPSARSLHYLLLGTIDGRTLSNRAFCQPSGGTARAPQFRASDFDDWTMVTIRKPKPAEATTLFYDIPALRSATELVLTVPRIGFFSTPAFFANWDTNLSNQMRVTIHQALIVATGSSIDGTDATDAPGAPGLDARHSASGACYGCHRVLDPTRSIFSATWSWNYHNQLDPAWSAQPGMFAFRGVVQPVRDLTEFGAVLAQHPLVAPGWVQKLCYYVNSAPCDESDPEFQRVVSVVKSSGYSWRESVKALVTSPLTTFAQATKTTQHNGGIVAVLRRDHLCAALDARLGLRDVCGLDASNPGERTSISQIVPGLPSDSYGRGAVAPILPNQPTPFFVAGLENICKIVAAKVIDAPVDNAAPDAKIWSSAEPDAAISDFVSIVMGLTASDPRAARARDLLARHFEAARAQSSAAQALQSTFVVACLAPSAVSLGL